MGAPEMKKPTTPNPAKNQQTSVRYDPAFCEVARRLAAQGAGYVGIAQYIGTTPKALKRWENNHPDFRDAMTPAYKNDMRRKLFSEVAEEIAERARRRERNRRAKDNI
ncbi:MAG: hypothetical protein AB7S74_17535 [Hyphomicrobium sp.]